MRINPLYIAAVALSVLLMPSQAATTISQIVVFGDSLSDNGNAAAAIHSAGQSLGNYALNGYTDGTNTLPATSSPLGLWIDHFAASLGVADPQPFVTYTPGGMLSLNTSGTNFAVASAIAGNNPSFSYTNFLSTSNPQAPGTTNQVELYLSFNGYKASPNTLYVFWAGANNLYGSLGNVSSFFTFPAIAKNAADSIALNIATLAQAGAKHFLWLNLPPLDQIPYVNDNSNVLVRRLGKPAADSAALVFNDELAFDVLWLKADYGVDITVVNTNSLFNSIVAAPGTYGFVNIKDAGWCGVDGVPTCAQDNPNGFLFWDELHPTTAAHAILGQFAYSYVAGRF
jgi:phospholipase/lecithinase/hemolysin